MARPGKAPRPDAIQALHGVKPYRRKPEPVPLARPLVMPDYLPADARTIWSELAEELDGLGIARAIDSEALGVFAVLLARFRAEAEAEVPDVRALRMLGDSVRLWTREFGFTPSARVGLAAAPPPADPGRLLSPVR